MTALSFVWVHPYSKNSRCDNYINIFTGIFVQPLRIRHIIIGLYRAARETGQFQAPMPKAQDNKPKKD